MLFLLIFFIKFSTELLLGASTLKVKNEKDRYKFSNFIYLEKIFSNTY